MRLELITWWSQVHRYTDVLPRRSWSSLAQSSWPNRYNVIVWLSRSRVIDRPSIAALAPAAAAVQQLSTRYCPAGWSMSVSGAQRGHPSCETWDGWCAVFARRVQTCLSRLALSQTRHGASAHSRRYWCLYNDLHTCWDDSVELEVLPHHINVDTALLQASPHPRTVMHA